MKTLLIKLITILPLLFFSGNMLLFAQDQQICLGDIENYSVDTDPTAPGGTPGDGPSGTPGSSYTWSVLEATFSGSIDQTANASGNVAEIDWGSSPSGTYTVQVVESGSGCPATPQTISVVVNIAPVAPTVTANAASVCSGADAQFTITGDANATVTYQINGGADQNITLDAAGQAVITEPNVSTDTAISITELVNSLGCSIDLTASPVTATVSVLAAITEPTITSMNNPICLGEDAEFVIAGDAGAVVTYSLDGGVTSQTITIESDGDVVVTVPTASPATDITLEISEVSAGSCSSNFTISETIMVNDAPTTTAIDFTP